MNMYLLQWNTAEKRNILFNIYFKIFANSHILQNRRYEYSLSSFGFGMGHWGKLAGKQKLNVIEDFKTSIQEYIF